MEDHLYAHAVMHVFVARDWQEGVPANEPDEEIEHVWLPEAQMEDMVRRGEMENGHALAVWALYRAWRAAEVRGPDAG
ncbi:MAG: NUDIX hydrolase [Anaerolineae bacterium]